MFRLHVVFVDIVLVIVLGVLGVLGARLLRRRSTLSVKNVYLAAAVIGLAFVVGVAVRAWTAVLGLAPVASAAVSGAASGRRWRLADLGAGEELRQHELSRRWIWQPAPARRSGERLFIASQGEIVHQRPWPGDVEYVAMTTLGDRGARLPLGEGQHVFECGGTGTGKTTTARRLLAERTRAHGAAALLIDQKGDPEDEEQLRRIAAAAGRPFVLFDPRDPETDRWQPLWGAPADIAARAVEAIKRSEPYYGDVLRQHLNLIVEVLFASDRWPPSFPFLVDAARASRYETICDLAAGLSDDHRLLKRRVEEHAEWVGSRDGKKDLAGGLVRLDLVMGAAWRQVLTPRLTADGDTVAVSLVQAISAGAVVMWRTYADDMPDEAAAITVLALADLHAAAGQAGAPWTLMLDEFGAVIHMAAARAVAILQRARSHQGQVIVITQSAADIEALSQQPGLLPSLSDNFSAFVAHRQTAPETRDWLAKLMGTRAIWQSTDQAPGLTAMPTGSGSRRRVREFRVGSDVFATLQRGEAIIYTTLGPEPQRASILAGHVPPDIPNRIGHGNRHAAEIRVHPEETLPMAVNHTPPHAGGGRDIDTNDV
ncbi:MAG: TraG/TraD/VirD4 family protein [Actinomycetota bacterium]|nr:TraG/TraD/VirD4 family protein [Actinomycetota bacterium]